ncbi:MAG: ribonuclease P protein component [Firmicutes bacterium]|nr:ribonuclease P protein component [Bacillota bacterium]
MLSKKYRLTKRGSFTFVYNKGERKSDGPLRLTWVAAKNLRIGFSVPNKVGKAVVRNQLKRRLRAVARQLLKKLRPAQIVVSAQPCAEKLSYEALYNSVCALFDKAKLWA